MTIQETLDIQKQMQAQVEKTVQAYLGSNAFTARKLTDTPTDDLQVVNRKYVTGNGVTANRPPSPVAGQFYLDTSLGIPIWWDGGSWIDAQGNNV